MVPLTLVRWLFSGAFKVQATTGAKIQVDMGTPTQKLKKKKITVSLINYKQNPVVFFFFSFFWGGYEKFVPE